jgi:hypothetical protein
LKERAQPDLEDTNKSTEHHTKAADHHDKPLSTIATLQNNRKKASTRPELITRFPLMVMLHANEEATNASKKHAIQHGGGRKPAALLAQQHWPLGP